MNERLGVRQKSVALLETRSETLWYFNQTDPFFSFLPKVNELVD